jgi:hypothetical protein
MLYFEYPDGKNVTNMFIRLNPIPRSISSGSRLHFFLPSGTRLAADYTEVQCNIRLANRPRRAFMCTDKVIDAKREGMRASMITCSSPVDIDARDMVDTLVTCGPFYAPEGYEPSSDMPDGRIYLENGLPVDVNYGFIEADFPEPFFVRDGTAGC